MYTQNNSNPSSIPPCYLDDVTTVGEVMRWINEEHLKAGKNRDDDMRHAMYRLGSGLESAWRAYFTVKD